MRLIDADNLKKRIYNDIPLKYFLGRDIGRGQKNMEFMLTAVDIMPTVDTVKHAHWTDNKGTRCAYEHSCSLCGFGIDDFDLDFLTQPVPDYCPNCGAKMDEQVAVSEMEITKS